MDAPTLHDLLETLAPFGWRRRGVPGCWRPVGSRSGQFISVVGAGVVEIWGSGLRNQRLSIDEVVPFLDRHGQMKTPEAA